MKVQYLEPIFILLLRDKLFRKLLLIIQMLNKYKQFSKYCHKINESLYLESGMGMIIGQILMIKQIRHQIEVIMKNKGIF